MDNNKFLKKYSGSSELVGREGPLGILNNLHANISGYKPIKIKKIKQPTKPEPDYSYVSSIVKEDFNQNKNFIPQLSVQLNPMKFKDNQIYNNIVKNYELKKLQVKNNFVSKNNELDDDIIYKKIQNPKDNGIKIKYTNTNKKADQNLNVNNEFNFYNYKGRRMLLNNNPILNNNSNEILPLISNRSQEIKHTSEISKRKFKNKKTFTPIMKKQFSLVNKINSSSNNFKNAGLLKKSNSTMNIRSQNINNNIFPYRNKKCYIDVNENSNYKSNNLRNINEYKFRSDIEQNKKHIVNQVLLNNNENKIRQQKRIIKNEFNNFNNDNRFNSYSYKYDDEKNLNYKQYNNDNNINNEKYIRSRNFSRNKKIFKNKNPSKDNNLDIINEEEEENNKRNKINNMQNNQEPNMMEILMMQRQQYFNNIQNNLRLQRYMENS